MSIFAPAIVPCPVCGVPARRSLARSINAARSPRLRGQILEGTFQHFICGACGEAHVVESPFVYTDAARSTFVHCLPTDDEGAWKAQEAAARRLIPRPDHFAPGTAAAPGLHARVVFGLPALREKIVCFDAGLDDAVLETMKLDMMRQIPGLVLHAAARPRLLTAGGDLVFVAPDAADDDALLRVPIQRGDYDQHAACADCQPLIAEQRSGLYVDAGRWLIGGDQPIAHSDHEAGRA